jgi:hypothetical protein
VARPRRSLEQPDAEQILETLDAIAEGGGRKRDLARGLAEVLVVRRSREAPE